jgi:predicted house-cleaning noncanonical NTP pyrophosphatase (MazG superfamily)
MRVAYNKLVRDQIPDIIAAAGRQPSTRILDHASYQVALRTKLLEEAREAEAAADEQLASELADVLEVLRALATAPGFTALADSFVMSVSSCFPCARFLRAV